MVTLPSGPHTLAGKAASPLPPPPVRPASPRPACQVCRPRGRRSGPRRGLWGESPGSPGPCGCRPEARVLAGGHAGRPGSRRPPLSSKRGLATSHCVPGFCSFRRQPGQVVCSEDSRARRPTPRIWDAAERSPWPGVCVSSYMPGPDSGGEAEASAVPGPRALAPGVVTRGSVAPGPAGDCLSPEMNSEPQCVP